MSTVRLVRESQSEVYFSHAHVVGWLFVVLGTGVAYYGAAWLEERGPGRWLVVAVGVLFAVIGVLAALWRYELSLDLLSRRYRRRRGFWPSPRLHEGSLEELRGVFLERVLRPSSSSKGSRRDSVHWVVGLDFGEWKVQFFGTQKEAKAHGKLEHFAKLLRVPAIDRTAGEETRRPWEALDRSLGERVREEGAEVAAPGAPPLEGRIVWDPTPDMASIVLPPLGFSVALVAIGLFGLLFAAFGAAALLALGGVWDVPVSGSRATGWVLGFVFVAIGALIVVGGVWGSYARQVIREERDGLLFYLTLLGRRYRRQFVARRGIEEVSLKPVNDGSPRRRSRVRVAGLAIGLGRTSADAGDPPQEVAVRTDGTILRLGQHLSAEERRWLLQALRHLAAR